MAGYRLLSQYAGSETEANDPRAAPTTSAARRRSDGGIVRPSALAVLRLITSSNLVGCSTARSAGLAPFRILSTKIAERSNIALMLGPYDMRRPSSTGSL